MASSPRQPSISRARDSSTGTLKDYTVQFDVFVRDVSDSAIFVLDADGRIVSWNQGAERIKGYRAEEIIGQPLEILYTPEDRAQGNPARAIRLAAAEGQCRDEGWRLRKDGTRFWSESVLTALRDHTGGLLGFAKMTSDRTERKHAEEVLQTRHRQQQVVADFGERALAGTDIPRLMAEAVVQVAQTLGVDYGQVLELVPDGNALRLRAGVGWRDGYVGVTTVGVGSSSLAGYALLRDEPVVIEDLRAETRFRAPPHLLEHRVISGITVIIRGRKRPFGVLGAHTRQRRTFSADDVSFVASIANVLALAIERKQAEEDLKKREAQLTEAQHLAQLGSWEWDIATDTVTWSDELFRIWGMNRQEFGATYEAVFQLVHPEDRERLAALIKRAYREHEPYTCEHRIIRPDGTMRILQSRGAVVVDEASHALRMFGTGQDITARKEAEMQLQASLHEKEVLLKEIHHRVKNNLQIIISLLSLQARSLPDPQLRAYFQDSRDRVKAMALVHEALYRAPDLARVDFGAYLRRLATALFASYRLDAQHIELTVTAEPLALDLDTAIPCGLIVNELLTNAFKHAFPDGRAGAIHLTLQATAGLATLTVQDTGVGFPADVDVRQADSLGLRIVDHLAEQLGGSLALTRGAGTAFTLVFPVSAVPGSGDAHGDRAHPRG